MSSTGKIFAESSNIYEDEAKVLFNYYQQAAERIVKEEERIEMQISTLQSNLKMLEEKMSKLWIWIFAFVIPYFVKKKALLKEINDTNIRITEFQKQHKEIFRDYKVSKLGVAYVPIADQIQYEDKSFIVDYTGEVENSHVKLQLSRQNQLLGEAIGNLERLNQNIPIVETSNDAETVPTDDYSLSIQQINQNDYLGQLDRSLRTISYCMNDLDVNSVALPLVQDNSERLININNYATTEVPQGHPIVEVFDKGRYQSEIEKFQELNRLKSALSTQSEQFEDVLKNLMRTMAESVQAISAMKLSSSSKIIADSNKLLYRILKAPYNHYSPLLEAEEILRIKEEKFDYTDSVQGYTPFTLRQSSRVRYNPVTEEWIAEDGSRTTMPFGIHQVYEEIVAPIVQNLMQENRIERLKIYNHIKDQKISYLNKWHQDTDAFYRDNRKQSADLINLMQESLREYVASYNTLVSFQKTQESMEGTTGGNEALAQGSDAYKVENKQSAEEAILAFEAQAKQFEAVQADFEAYIDRLKEDIDNRADQFGHVEYYDARLQDGHSNEAAIANSEVGLLDERRKELAAANPLLAKKTEVPPTPHVEDITYQDLAINLNAIAKTSLDNIESLAQETAEEPIDVESATPEVMEEESPIETNGNAMEGKNNFSNSENEQSNTEIEEKEEKEEEIDVEDFEDKDFNEEENEEDIDEDDEEDEDKEEEDGEGSTDDNQ